MGVSRPWNLPQASPEPGIRPIQAFLAPGRNYFLLDGPFPTTMHTTRTVPSQRTLLLATEAATEDLGTLPETFDQAGFTVAVATLSEATTAVRSAPPDLVVIDARRSPEPALGLCRSLRSICSPTTPILLLHDGADPEWIDRACEAGATEFAEPPFHPTLLERRLDSAIAYVERLIDSSLLGSDALAGFGSPRAIAAPSVFPRLVSVAIEQCRTNDNSVCVLAVCSNAHLEGQQRFPDTFAHLLSRAVREFEQEGPASHPKGHIVISRVNETCFALLVPEIGRIQDAARLGYRIHEVVQSDAGGNANHVSIGIATSPGDSNEGQNLVRYAEEAAERIRQDEGNSLSFRTESTNRWVFERLTLERSLRNAIEREELIVYYQPKVDIVSRELVGFEALLRWQHPELGMVSPAQFIPLAEETGLIIPIGEWVLESACHQVQAWHAAGFAPVRMAVNLSPVQFRSTSLCDTVAKVLERTGMPASLLELEVTESMLMYSLKDTINTLQRLKATGIYLSIDDFGTGYSSLSYLKGFPIDALKIDRSFVRDITANADDAAIATSIILMGRSLNLKVIAEGVETESQRAFLQVLQCDEIQGYLISPPVPAEKAEAFLKTSDTSAA